MDKDALASLRKSYERAELSEHASHADPLTEFDEWLSDAIAAQVAEKVDREVATNKGPKIVFQ